VLFPQSPSGQQWSEMADIKWAADERKLQPAYGELSTPYQDSSSLSFLDTSYIPTYVSSISGPN